MGVSVLRIRRDVDVFVRICFVLMVAAGLGSGTAHAGDSQVKLAREQMERGYKAAKRGYWQEALNRFERANKLTPDQPRILNNVAVALEASGRFEEALLEYEAALSLAPNDRILRRNFSQFREFYDTQVAPEPPSEETADTQAKSESQDEQGETDRASGEGSEQEADDGQAND
jgi:tetratricopeptide (TPR) repeat protein